MLQDADRPRPLLEIHRLLFPLLRREAAAIITHNPVEMKSDKDNEDPNGDDGIALRLIVYWRECNYLDPVCDYKKADKASFYREISDYCG
jgi:hypothetical protein